MQSSAERGRRAPGKAGVGCPRDAPAPLGEKRCCKSRLRDLGTHPRPPSGSGTAPPRLGLRGSRGNSAQRKGWRGRGCVGEALKEPRGTSATLTAGLGPAGTRAGADKGGELRREGCAGQVDAQLRWAGSPHVEISAFPNSRLTPQRKNEWQRQCRRSLSAFSRGCVPQENGRDTTASSFFGGELRSAAEASANNRSRRKLYKHTLNSWLGFTAPCG